MHDERILKEWRYVPSNYHILVKYQQPDGGILSDRKSSVHEQRFQLHWRFLSVEHITGERTRHDMFDGVLADRNFEKRT